MFSLDQVWRCLHCTLYSANLSSVCRSSVVSVYVGQWASERQEGARQQPDRCERSRQIGFSLRCTQVEDMWPVAKSDEIPNHVPALLCECTGTVLRRQLGPRGELGEVEFVRVLRHIGGWPQVLCGSWSTTLKRKNTAKFSRHAFRGDGRWTGLDRVSEACRTSDVLLCRPHANRRRQAARL